MGMATFHQWQALRRAQIKYDRITPFLSGGTYLDIGCGNGALTYLLQSSNYKVQAADIVDKSLFPTVAVTLFDGKTLPFQDNAFDGILLITVLHHAKEVETLLLEARRVAKGQIIIMEDIYTNNIQKWLTYQMDSIVNGEWKGHPHNNKTHTGWMDTFTRLELSCEKAIFHRFLGVFKQVTYVLKT